MKQIYIAFQNLLHSFIKQQINVVMLMRIYLIL